jgi:hypothetical protein
LQNANTINCQFEIANVLDNLRFLLPITEWSANFLSMQNSLIRNYIWHVIIEFGCPNNQPNPSQWSANIIYGLATPVCWLACPLFRSYKGKTIKVDKN